MSRSRSWVVGYTLVELLIVCGVLAAIAAMSWPAVQGSLAKSRLKKAASDLRTAIGRTRNDAIRQGQSFMLCYELDGRRYRIEPFAGRKSEEVGRTGEAPVSQNDGSTLATESTSDEERDFEPLEHELPEGVLFAAVDDVPIDDLTSPLSSGQELTSVEEGFPGTETPETTEWSQPIVFHANGRTDNGQLRLINQRNFFIDLSLRGLTGIVTSTPPARIVTDNEDDGQLSDGTDATPLPVEGSQP